MQRLAYTRRQVALGGLALGAAGCGSGEGEADNVLRPSPSPAPATAFKPLDVSMQRWMRTTVCLRPFRKAGPRLDVEQVGDKRVVHSYGHGGAGWSLAWGSAEAAAALALSDGPSSVAVIGAGCIGLTAAIVLQRAGVPTSIYAEEFIADSRSAQATGSWSPDSRIALTAEAGSGFPARWERWARRSYAVHQSYVGLSNHPVEFTPRYIAREPNTDGPPLDAEFARLNRRIRDLTPRWTTLSPGEHPLALDQSVRHGFAMTFNVAAYSQQLVSDFLAMGGSMRRQVFRRPQDLSALPHPVIVNCTGYGARALWDDSSVLPVRGQIGWFAPQPDRLYGAFYRDVFTISRRDGIAVQYLGPNDHYGFDRNDEEPDAEELSSALATLAPLFERA